jgi:radical SAM protein with 4Fe4S-binding SPASM domain
MKNRLSCSEPQHNMYISRDGLVKVCCHNHYFEIGNLRKNTLSEIWNSEKRKYFSKLLYKSSDEPSCGNCTLKKAEKRNDIFFSKKLKISPYPKSIEFELSNKCNLECIMCSPLYSNQIEKRYHEITNDSFDFHSITEQLEPFVTHLQEAKFYGGEPFIIEQYFDIWEYIISKNPACKFYIQTNGTVLNEKIQSILNKGIFNIGVSLESVQPETYKHIRVNAGLEKVLSNIDYFNNYSKQKKTFLGVAICPIRSNWKELPELIRFFNKKEIPVNFHQVIRPFNVTLWNLPNKELYHIYKTLSECQFEHSENHVCKSNISNFKKLLDQISEWHTLALERENKTEFLNNKTEQELLKEIENIAMNFLESIAWLNKEITNHKKELFIEKLNEVCKNIQDKTLLKSKLFKLQQSPIYIVLGEIERISIQELTENLLSI